MTKRKRTILFIFIVVLFFLVAPLMILYSLGYRFDFENNKFYQTGAFSFKVRPQGALILIDNKLKKKAGFPFGTVYVDNLLPKKYKVEITKEGYFSWIKTLEIKEELVTENKNIFLVPENPQFNHLKEGGDDFFLSPDGKKAILKKNGEESWALTLLNIERNASLPLFKNEDFLDKKNSFFELEWALDSRKFLLKTGDNNYFIVETNETPNIFPLDFLGEKPMSVSFGPRNSQIIFLTQQSDQKNILFSVNYKEKNVSGLILDGFLIFEYFDNRLFWLDEAGFLRQSDLSGNEIGLLSRDPFQLDNDPQLKLIIFSEDKIFLKTDGNLYFLDVIKKSFEKISEGIKEVKISPDSKKIVYVTDHEIWLLFLDKTEEQPQGEEGGKIFLARFSGNIGNVFWWTTHYLIFSVSNKVKITEIDNRDKINIYDLTEFNNPEISWNHYNKKLYILSGEEILVSEKLIP